MHFMLWSENKSSTPLAWMECGEKPSQQNHTTTIKQLHGTWDSCTYLSGQAKSDNKAIKKGSPMVKEILKNLCRSQINTNACIKIISNTQYAENHQIISHCFFNKSHEDGMSKDHLQYAENDSRKIVKSFHTLPSTSHMEMHADTLVHANWKTSRWERQQRD